MFGTWSSLLAVICQVGAAGSVYNLWRLYQAISDTTSNSFTLFVNGIVALGFIMLSVICLDIRRKRPSDSHSMGSLFRHYMFLRYQKIRGKRYLEFLKDASIHPRDIQQATLMKHIRTASGCRYGKDHGFENIETMKQYFSSQPYTSYDDYNPYIKLSMEEGVLDDVTFKGRICFYGATSGTTGNNKIFAMSEEHFSDLLTYFLAFVYKARNQFSCFKGMKKIFMLRVEPTFKVSPHGIKIGPISCYKSYGSIMTTPFHINVAASAISEDVALYVHGLFALADREVECLWLTFVGVTKAFIRILENKWQQICDDIERGEISLQLPENIRKDIDKILQPNKRRADELRSQFEKGLDGIFRRVWPHAQCIIILTSGSFKSSAEHLKKSFFGDIPVLSYFYAGTESSYGLLTFAMNNNAESNYTPLLDSVFYEFIPVSDIHEQQPDSKFIHELQLGQEYEIVVTNGIGMYRYRSGDVVKVVGFWNHLPLIDPMFRVGQILNLADEKVSETALADGFKIACDKLSVTLLDYTSVEGPKFEEVTKVKAKGGDLYQVIFIELSGKHGEMIRLLDEEKIVFDEGLMEAHEYYRKRRHSGPLAPLLVFQVKFGTFHNFRKMVLASNQLTSAAQFKQPRAIKKHEHILFLMENVV